MRIYWHSAELEGSKGILNNCAHRDPLGALVAETDKGLPQDLVTAVNML